MDKSTVCISRGCVGGRLRIMVDNLEICVDKGGGGYVWVN